MGCSSYESVVVSHDRVFPWTTGAPNHGSEATTQTDCRGEGAVQVYSYTIFKLTTVILSSCAQQ